MGGGTWDRDTALLSTALRSGGGGISELINVGHFKLLSERQSVTSKNYSLQKVSPACGLPCCSPASRPAPLRLGSCGDEPRRKKIKNQDEAIPDCNLSKQWHLGFPLLIPSVNMLQSRNYRGTFSIWAESSPLPHLLFFKLQLA